MEKIDKIIKFIREDAMVVGSGGFTGSANSQEPVAGFDPVLGLRKRKDGNIDKRIRKLYKKWLGNN